jgi:NADH-quinone oxidoreductase subunit I
MSGTRPRLTLAERVYLPEVLRGIGVTTRHFVRNLGLHTLHLFGLAKDRRAAVTTQYPEERKVYSDGYRGAHRLTLKPDGAVRCTACFLCATACPAKCINIEAGEHPDSEVEKFPVRYEIDTLQCIYCGMCVEACPCDAIRMDTYVHPKIWGYAREDFVETKQVLMNRSRVLAERGRDALMQDMLREYREDEAAAAEGR